MKGGSKVRVIREILGFFESALMGCLLSCFRIKENARRKSSSCENSIVSGEGVSLVSKKDAATDSLFQSKGKEAHALTVKFGDDSILKDYKIENCKAPEEIQETSNKVFFQTFVESGPVHQNLGILDSNLGQPEDSFQGCIFEEQRAMRKVLQSDGHNCMSQVDCEQDSAKLDISPSPNYTKIQTLDNKSPCPTPLNLNDQMQTPGTVCPVNLDNSTIGKSTSIRTEYVYPAQWVFLGQEPFPHAQSDDTFEQQLETPRTDNSERGKKALFGADNFINSRLPTPSRNNNHDASLISTNKSVCKNSLSDLAPLSGCSVPVNIEPETPEFIIPCSSQWLKPQTLNNEKGDDIHISNQQYFPPGMNFHADRPIIGTVAAHWIGAEPISNSPKRWDGNGIPNSTTKYKEDQKVSWHATPFEERLEKVLSDEKHLPQRKVLYREPIELKDESRAI